MPQARVSAEASALVCHGGDGTVLGAVAAGGPPRSSPRRSPTSRTTPGGRVRQVGAGITRPVGPPARTTLADPVGTVPAEPGYSSAATRVADDIPALAPVDEGVARFESVAGGR